MLRIFVPTPALPVSGSKGRPRWVLSAGSSPAPLDQEVLLFCIKILFNTHPVYGAARRIPQNCTCFCITSEYCNSMKTACNHIIAVKEKPDTHTGGISNISLFKYVTQKTLDKNHHIFLLLYVQFVSLSFIALYP